MTNSVLVVDDETTLAKNIVAYLERFDYDARGVASGEEALEVLEHFKPDAVLLDLQLPGMDGMSVLAKLRATDPQVRIIVMTGHGSVQIAVDAMKAGADEYLSKPLVLAELKLQLEKLAGQEKLQRALAYHHAREASQSGLVKLVGESAALESVRAKIEHYIEAERRLTDANPPAVLITGETGTGKELVARAFHFDGPRREQPFVEINCASIPAELLEAELFGFERGAFTNAHSRKLGLAESADGGTLFLDEIGDLDLTLQAKLLTLLEQKRVRRIGALRDQPVNVRIIAATNQPLDERVSSGTFRSDLYFRLKVVHVDLPRLREREGDVLLLAEEFLRRHEMRYAKSDLSFDPATRQLLAAHHWPGNVRELSNVIEHAVLLAEESRIEPRHLTLSAFGHGSPGTTQENTSNASGAGPAMHDVASLPDSDLDLRTAELVLINEALRRTHGNITRAAKLLGLSRDTLRYRMQKYEFETEQG
ncbi:MAG: sigma-54-dependent transcriptional regulator [Gammaproteobacteria bacterium]